MPSESFDAYASGGEEYVGRLTPPDKGGLCMGGKDAL